jgi:LysM repeat protein
MNNNNPLVPHGSVLEQQSKKRSNLVIALVAIGTLHVALIIGLLFQGCKRDEKKADTTTTDTTTNTGVVSGVDTNPFYQSFPPVDTNPMVGGMAQNQGYQPITSPATTAAPVNPVDTAATTPTAVTDAATTATTTTAGALEYKIVSGDTLEKVAKNHSVSLKALTSANPGIDARKLKVGQMIHIPSAEAAKDTATPKVVKSTKSSKTKASAKVRKSEASDSSKSTYTVKAGDTLYKVSRELNVSVKTLRATNKLKSDKLHVGQKLTVPKGSVKVAKSDTASVPKTTEAAPTTSTSPKSQ